MYAIYANIYHQYTPNVSIYTIHGSYGFGKDRFNYPLLISHMSYWKIPQQEFDDFPLPFFMTGFLSHVWWKRRVFHCFPQVFFPSTQSSLQSLGRTLVAKDAISMSRHLPSWQDGWGFSMWDEATDPLESHGKLSMPERHLDLELGKIISDRTQTLGDGNFLKQGYP